MISRTTKLRWRRKFRKRRLQVEDLGAVTEQSFERHLFRRLIKLVNVRRFVLGWVGLLVLLTIGLVLQNRALSGQYQELRPASGGSYREGIIGTFTNASPLYAQNSVDASVAKLIFSGLFKYDKTGNLVPDLAESYSLDPSETLYTVKLKPNAKWHDGKPVTAKDVAFTYKRIQNPEVKSFLLASWRGVAVEAKDDQTVTFKLPNALSAFPQSMTNGIIPEHILSQVSPAQMRSNSFNNERPIGSGPFKIQAIEVDQKQTTQKSERIAMTANHDYHIGSPKIERFVIRTYKDENTLTEGFKTKQIDGMLGLTSAPEKTLEGSQKFEIPLSSEVMVFFRNTQEILTDTNVRKALVLGTDKTAMFESVPYPLLSVDSPLLRSHIGYDKALVQITNKKTEANALLDQAGWKKDPQTGLRSKNNVKLEFKLFAAATSEFTAISGNLQKQWHELGVDAQVVLQPDEELQSSVSTHNYDAVLYGISVGPDPDVFAYWHSTQGDIRSNTRLNLSEYKSTPADRALEAGRTRSDPQNRGLKYRPFLEAWRNDAPALALYQPRFLYITSDSLKGFEINTATLTTDRFAEVENWSTRQALQNR